MKMPIICIAMLTAFCMPAAADTQYDRKLEKAVMEIVAGRMGGLRGGFAHDAKPAFVVVRQPMIRQPAAPDPFVTGSIFAGGPFAVRSGWSDGQALARQRKVSRIIAF